MKANEILDLLAERHSKDLFVPECKDGQTWGRLYSRLDAWVLKKSYSPRCSIGYEIKVSRSDFMNDKKYHNYLPLCNEFYFVAPRGILDKNELPAEVGYIQVSKNLKKLYCKKKAVYRKIENPEALKDYILISRAIIKNEQIESSGGKEYWEKWLKDKQINREFGYKVGKAIKETIKEKIDSIQEENNALKFQIENLEEIKQIAEELGINFKTRFLMKAEVKKAITGIGLELIRATAKAKKSIIELEQELLRFEK